MSAMVLMIDPKYDHNVGAAVRACAVFGATTLRWTGDRVTLDGRIPREERLKDYRDRVDFRPVGSHLAARPIDQYVRWGVTPVAVERRAAAESLVEFDHPERAVYVFGPEDGGLTRGILGACHRFVCIPGDGGPLNLAAAINVVLYDRIAKATRMAAVA